MLRRFRTQGFKSLRDVSVELAPLTVFFGPNAAGKSNLLEAMMLCARAATARTFTEAFERSTRGRVQEAFSLPVGGLPELLSASQASLRFEADLDDTVPRGRSEGHLRYVLGIDMVPSEGALTLADESLGHVTADGAPNKRIKPAIEPGEQDLVIRSRKGHHPFVEEFGLHHGVLSNLRFSGDRFPECDAVRAAFGDWRHVYLDPREAMRSEQAPREVDGIGERGEHLAPALHRLKTRNGGRGLKAVERTLRSVVPTVDALRVQLNQQRGSIDVEVVEAGTPYSIRVLSEGTLRVLGLCTLAVLGSSGLLAFEEPESGVHPTRIEVIANLLLAMARRGRQVVVTTHSPVFASAMLRRSRAGTDGLVRLYSVSRRDDGTTARPFAPPEGLFEDQEIRAALSEPDEDALLQAWMVRGWMDA